MRASEVISIIVISLLGWTLMFLGQPWIYRSRFVPLTDVRSLEVWLSNYYITGANIVFWVSVISVVLWYWMAAKAQVKAGTDVERWTLIWWLLLLLPVFSICIAIGFYKGSDQALLSLTGFFVIDILILYWFTTAISSPGSLNYVPPGAFLIRRLFRN